MAWMYGESLGVDVKIVQFPALEARILEDQPEQICAGRLLPCIVRVREPSSDVSYGDRAQDCIDDCVEERVSV